MNKFTLFFTYLYVHFKYWNTKYLYPANMYMLQVYYTEALKTPSSSEDYDGLIELFESELDQIKELYTCAKRNGII